jgi:hypothetical protein
VRGLGSGIARIAVEPSNSLDCCGLAYLRFSNYIQDIFAKSALVCNMADFTIANIGALMKMMYGKETAHVSEKSIRR